MTSLVRLFKEMARTWRQQPATQLSSLVVMIFTFIIIGGLWLGSLNMKFVLSHWGQEIQMTVFLQEDIAPEDKSKIELGIQKIDQFKSISFVDKEQAKERFLQQMPGFTRDLIEDPDFANPFPSSFVAGGISAADISHLPDIAESIRKWTGVEDVSYGQEWVENYAGLVSLFESSTIFIILTLLFASFFIISSATRMAIEKRRKEIEILELVGATSSMIRAPFIFEGTINGLFSSSLALVALYGVFHVAMKTLKAELGFLGLAELCQFFSLPTAIGFVVVGSIVGFISSYICVRRLNTGWSAREAMQ